MITLVRWYVLMLESRLTDASQITRCGCGCKWWRLSPQKHSAEAVGQRTSDPEYLQESWARDQEDSPGKPAEHQTAGKKSCWRMWLKVQRSCRFCFMLIGFHKVRFSSSFSTASLLQQTRPVHGPVWGQREWSALQEAARGDGAEGEFTSSCASGCAGRTRQKSLFLARCSVTLCLDFVLFILWTLFMGCW